VLRADGVRNLRPLQLQPHERFSVFVGDNGQGKSSLLEAIYVVAALRSFRTAKLADLIAFGHEKANIAARVTKDITRVYEVEISQGARKVRLDGKGVKPLARYFGGFNVVVFTPEDLGLPRGAPGDRRRFLDRAVFNLHGEYLVAVQDYDKVLRQRNTVLRMVGQNAMTRDRAEELLVVYDQQLATLGLAVANPRAHFLDEIRAELASAFQAIGRSAHQASVRYVSTTARSTVDAIVAQLRDNRERDFGSQSTQLGPHRDDLAFELDGRDAGGFASQGQLRAILLAWKTAEMQVLARLHGDLPILLLDDVSSELDPARNAYLFEHLATRAGQCFITTTDKRHVRLTEERVDYRIENGQISS
jgi:DNA replication and repair protein RecF